MLAALFLTLIAVAFRLLPPYLSASWNLDGWNFVPMGAVALYAGSRMPRRWAWLVPVAAMMLSDIVLDYGTHRPLFELSRWAIYATFGATTLLGLAAKQPRCRAWLLPALRRRLGPLLLDQQLRSLGRGLALPAHVRGACRVLLGCDPVLRANRPGRPDRHRPALRSGPGL